MDIVNRECTKLNPGGLGVWMQDNPNIANIIYQYTFEKPKLRTKEYFIKFIYKTLKDFLKDLNKKIMKISLVEQMIKLLRDKMHQTIKKLVKRCTQRIGKITKKERTFIVKAITKILNHEFWYDWVEQYTLY